MSRIKAAYHVLSAYFRERLTFSLLRKPIQPAGATQCIGYFDRIRLDGGRVLIDGWVDAPQLVLSTEFDELTVNPDLVRADVPSAHPTPGFSVSLRAGAQLVYCLPGQTDLAFIRLGMPASGVASLARAAIRLLPFAVRFRGDLAAYFIRGDVSAGDRLERALTSHGQVAAMPVAAAELFAKAAYPDIPHPVDIIVPVFNSAGDVEQCLDRLARNTAEQHRKIIVNDASTDAEINGILDRFAIDTPNVTVLTNGKNLGFVASVNRALEMVTGHAVILNSDAFVPPNWLERLMTPILSNPDIASVTPMSNNAEIFTLPGGDGQGGAVACSADVIDTALRQLDWRKSLAKAPTGVGFCMALNRTWLRKVPRFDAAFGRGYGEEVDWCQKVAQLGGVHVGLGSLFVEHRGGSSFGEEKRKRLSESNALIDARYPKFRQSVTHFRSADPLIGPRLASGIAAIDRGEEVPIYLAHSLGGGAEYWLSEQVARHVEAGEGAVVLRGDNDPARVLLEVHSAAGATRGYVARGDLSGFLRIPERICIRYSCLVADIDPIGLVRSVRDALRERDRLIVLFHDYFPVCPSYNLIGADRSYCGLPDTLACAKCHAALFGAGGVHGLSIEGWRDFWHGFMTRADTIVTFSNDSRNHVLRVWPDLAPRLVVRPHELTERPRPVRPMRQGKVVVGVLGGIGYVKGAALLKRLAEFTDGDFRLVVIGQMDPTYADSRIRIHGAFARKDISRLAEKYGVTCWLFPSIWPETYSFVVHECLSTGLPVFGFDIGAQGEALRSHADGRTMPADSHPADIRRRIEAETAPLALPWEPLASVRRGAVRPDLRRGVFQKQE